LEIPLRKDALDRNPIWPLATRNLREFRLDLQEALS
jgi:hypothetical protein